MTRRRHKVLNLFADDASFTRNAGTPAHGKEDLRKMFAATESLTLMPFIHNQPIELDENYAKGTCAVEYKRCRIEWQ